MVQDNKDFKDFTF